MEAVNNIVILGAGSIGTAIGNALSDRHDLKVSLLSVEKDVVESIKQTHFNQKYFPNIRLHNHLHATTDESVVRDAELLFIAIPSVAVIDYMNRLKPYISEHSVLINLAKGFGCENRIIASCLQETFNNPVSALKGPSFSREIINNIPTSFTLASEKQEVLDRVVPVFDQTHMYVDTSTDLLGVEILSILKNIYAIIIGIVDAHFNSPNMRFLVFTKAFNEMRHILLHLGGKEETMFNYCGIGDFGLTALNDLSRNRTLGLLIGKGFFTEDISGKVVLEGRIAMKVFLDQLEKSSLPPESYGIMRELDKIFSGRINTSEFVNSLLKI